MKLTPFQLMALAISGFATIILIDVLAKYQNDTAFKEHISNLASNPTELLAIRTRRVAEENMTNLVPSPDVDTDVEDDDDDQ
jgi:hypothetical protein